MHELDENTHLDLRTVEAVVSSGHAGSRFIPARDNSAAAEKFRLLVQRFQRTRSSKPIRTVLVTSGIPAEGKSTIALNLATVLASNGATTLLLDADLRAPDLHTMLGFRPEPDLGSVLRGEVELQRAVRRIDPLGLYFLGPGERVHNPLPLLEGPTFANVIKRAREAFHWVIMDSSPLNLLADAQCIAPFADIILLVVRWGFTPKEELSSAIATLEGLPLLGMVINRFDETQESSYYSYYGRAETRPVLPSAPRAKSVSDGL